MDYRALAELVMMSLVGLSMFVVAAGVSFRLFLAPTLRELFGLRNEPEKEHGLLNARLTQIDERLDSIEGSLDRLDAADRFDRQIGGPKAG